MPSSSSQTKAQRLVVEDDNGRGGSKRPQISALGIQWCQATVTPHICSVFLGEEDAQSLAVNPAFPEISGASSVT